MHEANLAWDLVEAHRATMSVRELNVVFVKLGCRDFGQVIELVLDSVIRCEQSISLTSAERLSKWLSGFPEDAPIPRVRDLVHRCASAPR
jgi:hypothetical protein